ncbi:protein PLASTID MOVEMENT IMPAIRED 1-RELATED 1-like [Amaranthus tricolor]|uniref:protein PLASTID MOVEMENT IMPAIRED 1-RELATED 1-like n=1 Tax=Amaranthus tricolor TaxID=29722 RepID=UPI00258A7A0C|nr:protein PLASTID MOVEMENT IMPAIRED 1-RELATED 1-like [Amaranthus tricolor]
MFSKFKSGLFPDQNDSSDGELLRDIEDISKALYVENKTHATSLISYSKFGHKSTKSSFEKDEWLKEEQKHSSIWSWKAFKALTHIRQKKFNCYFFCHVHCIENLMGDFNDISMVVNWKRKDVVLKTLPSRVSNGIVEFEETLMSKCCVYGAKNGSGDFVKYEPKHFLLYASVIGGEGLEIGKHWVELTRLLPLTSEELEQDNCSGKWSTSFKLVGKAKGATLHVSFGFLITKDGLFESCSSVKPPLLLSLEQNGLSRMSSADAGSVGESSTLRRVGSVPNSVTNLSSSAQHLDTKLSLQKDAHDLSNSISMLYGKLEEGGVNNLSKIDMDLKHLEPLHIVSNTLSGSAKDFSGVNDDDSELTVVDKGVEPNYMSTEMNECNECNAEDLKASTVEIIDVAEIFKGEGIYSDEDIKIDRLDEASECVAKDAPIHKYSLLDTEESNLEEGGLDLSKSFLLQSPELEIPEDEMSVEVKVKHKASNLVDLLSLDDFDNNVVNDFCNLLQDMHSPSSGKSNFNLESPRERLLRQFEEEMMTSGGLLLDVEQYDECEAPSVPSSDYVESVELSPIFDTANLAGESAQLSLRHKLKASSLERLETQTLMQRWGLDEEDFLNSPLYSSGGFGSPIFFPPEEPVVLPPLAEGLEPLLHLKDGGYLRSMSPLHFRSAKNCGRLILQTSKTLVLPTELGSDIIDILHCLALVGGEKLSKKVRSLMPLDDISGKIMQQLAWEASYEAEVLESHRQASSQYESEIVGVEGGPHVHGSNCFSSSLIGCNIGSAYMAAKDLVLLGLDNIEPLLIEGLKIQSGMPNHDAPSSIRVKSVKEDSTTQHKIDYFDDSSDFMGVEGTAEYADELLELSISLDEWLRLDTGLSGDKNQVDKRTLRVLRAHHGKASYVNNYLGGGEHTLNDSRKCGFLGDVLTLILMLQLRDPLRNYEPVGGPMLGLIQAKRLFKPVTQPMEDDKQGEETVRFLLKDVHVASLNTESENAETWSSKRQQEAGSRWLLASGLTKTENKPRISKSRSIMRMHTHVLRKLWTKSFIWSISRTIHGVEADPQNPLTRNPDVIFPSETI